VEVDYYHIAWSYSGMHSLFACFALLDLSLLCFALLCFVLLYVSFDDAVADSMLFLFGSVSSKPWIWIG
jgi:hypothetical protein